MQALASLSRSSVNAAAIAAADLPTALVTVLYQHHMHTHVVDSVVKLLIRLCHHSLYRFVNAACLGFYTLLNLLFIVCIIYVSSTLYPT